MASETTPLLNGCVINIPKDKDVLPVEYNLTKGLSLEELMPYSNDVWWQNLRKAMLFLISTVWLVILVMACIIAVEEHNKGTCRATKNATRVQIDQGIVQLIAGNSTIAKIANSTIPSIVSLAV